MSSAVKPRVARVGWSRQSDRKGQKGNSGKRGDPAGQARVEAYALLISVFLWQRTLRESQGALAIMGDALGVLHDARRFRAKDKVLNLIMAELALIIAPMGQELRTAHLWTQRNSTCDLLSRLAEGKGVPEKLTTTMRTKRKAMRCQLLGKAPVSQIHDA